MTTRTENFLERLQNANSRRTGLPEDGLVDILVRFPHSDKTTSAASHRAAN